MIWVLYLSIFMELIFYATFQKTKHLRFLYVPNIKHRLRSIKKAMSHLESKTWTCEHDTGSYKHFAPALVIQH